MSKKHNNHDRESWFKQRDEARAASGTAPEGTSPELNQQKGAERDEANPQEPSDQNVGNRGIGQYSGQGVPAQTKK